MLITVSTMFIILTGPVAIVTSTIPRSEVRPMIFVFMVIMRYINHAINGLLYIISGSRFTAELMKMFAFSRCSKPRDLNPSISVTNATAMSDISLTSTTVKGDLNISQD